MLLFNIDFLLNDPFGFLLFASTIAVALVVGITVHEFSHAAVALMQGDDTAKRQGRVTLNPLSHLHPTGTLLIVIIGFGFGRPVPVRPDKLRNGRTGMALVSAAGPASNVVIALAVAGLFQLGLLEYADMQRVGLISWVTVTAFYLVLLNLVLAVFNLLPVPPLDGGGILAGIAPRASFPIVRTLQRIGPGVLMLVVLTSFVGSFSVLGWLFSPARDLAYSLVGA